MTPEQEEQVRRLLASAPPEAGMPAEVADRLDATLAGLIAERGQVAATETADPAPVPVDELEQRRRRRWPRLLVAAASVSVLAYGVGVTLGGGQMAGEDASTASLEESFGGDAGVADREGAGSGAKSGDEPEVLSPLPQGSTDSGSRAERYALLTVDTVRLHRSSLTSDVRRLIPDPVMDDRARDNEEQRAVAGFLSRCAAPDTSRGDRVAAVRLDGQKATLVLRKPADGSYVAEVYSCGDASRLLAVTEVPSEP